MTAQYPEAIVWRLAIEPAMTVQSIVGKGASKKIRKTLPVLAAANIECKIEPLTEKFLQAFLPLYTASIATKSAPKIFDVAAAIAQRQTEQGAQYLTLGLYEQGQLIGGRIFWIDGQLAKAAYRVFPKTFRVPTAASPSIVAEYYFLLYILDQQISEISYGKDSNCYGINFSIGLALYKLHLGARPRANRTSPVLSVAALEDPQQRDALIFIADTPGQVCTTAVIRSQKTASELQALYPDLWTYDWLTIIIQSHNT